MIIDGEKERRAFHRERSLMRKRNHVHHVKVEPLPRGSVGNLQSASPLRGWFHDKISNRFADRFYITLTLRQESFTSSNLDVTEETK